jgi:hypothetical protein
MPAVLLPQRAHDVDGAVRPELFGHEVQVGAGEDPGQHLLVAAADAIGGAAIGVGEEHARAEHAPSRLELLLLGEQ